jgi:hypothetical protein
MRWKSVLIGAVSLAGCATLMSSAKSLDEIHSGPDWLMERGEKLSADYQRDISRWANGRPLAALRSELVAAQFECGDGGMVCTRMFATRACQTDWAVTLPETGSKVTATFERDCVGTGGDWPEPKKSAIDDQLAPPPELE